MVRDTDAQSVASVILYAKLRPPRVCSGRQTSTVQKIAPAERRWDVSYMGEQASHASNIGGRRVASDCERAWFESKFK